ncbi:MAG: ribosome-recycling factor [Mycoplasmoidaceae bacterium]
MEWKIYEDEFKTSYDKKINWLHEELEKIRVGRVSSKIIENIQVESYGVSYQLIEIANISNPDAFHLLIKPYDKSTTKSILTSINKLNLNGSVQMDVDSIRIGFQAPTEETRIDASKKVKKIIDQGRIFIRDIRHHILSEIKKDDELTEDNLRIYKNQLDKLTKDYVSKIETIQDSKIKSVMNI